MVSGSRFATSGPNGLLAFISLVTTVKMVSPVCQIIRGRDAAVLVCAPSVDVPINASTQMSRRLETVIYAKLTGDDIALDLQGLVLDSSRNDVKD